MEFTLSAEQKQFAVSVHEMLTSADGPGAARRWAAGERKPGLETWRLLADLGVTGLMVAPEHGGQGADPADLVIACEEIGHHALPGPVAETLAAVPVLLAAGPGGVPWLGQLASGDVLATLAAPPLLPFAADADAAGLVLLAMGQQDDWFLWRGQPGQPARSVDAARTLAEVTPAEVIADGPAIRGALSRALEFGTLACAAQLLGAGRALLEASAGHARQRVQFGQPVGAFQAVKHHLADVLIGLEFARPLLFAAAIALRSGREDDRAQDQVRRDVSAAKVACTEAAMRAARTALQVHGAIGYTAEHDVSLYLTKVHALAAAWGGQGWHRARVLSALAGESG